MVGPISEVKLQRPSGYLFSTGIHILCEEINSAKPQAVFPMKCLSSMVNIKRGTSYCRKKGDTPKKAECQVAFNKKKFSS